MFNQRLYCYYCSTAFLNAASRIQVTTGEDTHWFNERGYEAIEELTDIMLAVKAEGKVFYIEINGFRSANLLLASMLIQGTAVCTSHAGEADRASRYLENKRRYPFG